MSVPVLGRVLQCADAETDKIVGVTDVDICVPVLRFVFGQAQLSGKAALLSIARLCQQFYGLPEDRRLLVIRAKKEAVHELGHTYGLVHCESPQCVMHYSNSIREVDIRPIEFCDDCLALLRPRISASEDRE